MPRYATTADVITLLALRPSDLQADRIGWALETVESLIDHALDRPLAEALPELPAEVPAPIHEAAAKAAAELYLSDAVPFGVIEGGPDTGPVRVRRDPLAGVADLLAPFTRAHGFG